jgi:hypothetical protein
MATPSEPTSNEQYEVEVAARFGSPGAWSVEAIDDDSGIEQAIFIGPSAEERAREYARHRYQV